MTTEETLPSSQNPNKSKNKFPRCEICKIRKNCHHMVFFFINFHLGWKLYTFIRGAKFYKEDNEFLLKELLVF